MIPTATTYLIVEMGGFVDRFTLAKPPVGPLDDVPPRDSKLSSLSKRVCSCYLEVSVEEGKLATNGVV